MVDTSSDRPNRKGLRGSRDSSFGLMDDRSLGMASSRRATRWETAVRHRSRVWGARREEIPFEVVEVVARKVFTSELDHSLPEEAAALRL